MTTENKNYHKFLSDNIQNQIPVYLSTYKKTYSEVFDICENKCNVCGGICIERANHEGEHAYYHIPLMFQGNKFVFCNQKGVIMKIV